MIRDYREGTAKEWTTLKAALHLEGVQAPIISVVGGGGKTTIINRLAFEYETEKMPAIVTTTTKMKVPDTDLLLTSPDIELFARMRKHQKSVWLGSPIEEGKIAPLPMAFLEAVRLFQAPILIEADGARRLPCKVPADHEPVLWGKTTVLLGVVGLDAIGRPIKEVCYRMEQVEQLLHKSREELLTCEDVAAIALSNKGMKKHMDPYMKYAVILNKADDESRIEAGEAIIRLLAEREFHDVLLSADLGACDTNEYDYTVMLLAAGSSSRFGSNKLLASVQGIPMYQRMLAVLHELESIHKIVVTGYDAVSEAASGVDVQIVENKNPELGISLSVRLGIEAAIKQNKELKGIVFMVCDQPGLSADTICKLIRTARRNVGKIICASQKGRRRNPVLWDCKYLKELCTLHGDQGGRQLLDAYEEELIYVEIDEKELKDIDTKKDLMAY